MTTLTAGLIDVFAETPLSGNPLAVVEGTDGLSESQMRRIAGEFSQAETTFVMRSDRADFRLRSFTAIGAEVVGAGHNALGAWLWLADQGRLGDLRVPRTFQQEIGDVVLPIVLQSIDGRVVGRMKQSPLKLSTRLDRPEALAAALALPSADIVTTPPPRTADTGANHLLVRVTDPTVVDRAEPKAAALLEVLRATDAEGCYVYAFDPASLGRAYARFFNPTVGLWEDAATGTAAGPLAAYLAHAGLITDELTVEQGTKMGRRSLLKLRLTPEPELSGAGVIVLRGLLEI